MRQKMILFLLLAFVPVVRLPPLKAQTKTSLPSRERPKLKDFGQSLKKLKWDPKANAVVEEPRPTPSKSDSDLEVIRVDTDLVISTFLVVDKKGQVVTGLTQSDFEITEDEQVQNVSIFALGDSPTVPRSIVLIIDYSGSQLPYLKTSVVAAKLLVDKLGPLDSMAIVTDDVELLVDFTTDKKKLKEKLDSLVKKTRASKTFLLFKPGKFGLSQQYSALMATLKEAFTPEDVRPIIIFQTDGDEIGRLQNENPDDYFVRPPLPANMSKREQEEMRKAMLMRPDPLSPFSIDDVYRAAEQSRTTIYTVIPGFKFTDLTHAELLAQTKKSQLAVMDAWAANSPYPQSTRKAAEERLKNLSDDLLLRRGLGYCRMQEALEKVSPLTGGLTSFLEHPDQAESIYSRILADMNQRYVLGYYPRNKERDGKRRRVKIEVRGHPEYEVIGRKAYYAPSSK